MILPSYLTGKNSLLFRLTGSFEIIKSDGSRRFSEFFSALDDVDALADPDEFLLTSRRDKQVFIYNSKTKAKRILPLGIRRSRGCRFVAEW